MYIFGYPGSPNTFSVQAESAEHGTLFKRSRRSAGPHPFANSQAAVTSGLSDLQNHDGYRGDATVGEFDPFDAGFGLVPGFIPSHSVLFRNKGAFPVETEV